LDSLVEFWNTGAGSRQQRGVHYLAADLARLAVLAGRPEHAARVAADLGALADKLPTATLRGLHQLCRGTAEADAALLRTAATTLAHRPLYAAHAHENAAVVLAGDGHHAEARTALVAALELYDRLGAAWDAARAKARLRGLGVRSRRPGGTRLPRAGWGALTDTERRVADLVAEGHSNPDIAARMFISRRTVQSHVSSILTKLNCTSRVEVAVAATRHTTG
jgi:DNA-binding CsgD family transcriptional regulator